MTASPDVNLDDLRRRARRRLVGAIVLALAAAVFVPMLLESDPKPLGEDVSVRIPPVDDGKFVNRLNEKAKAEPVKSHGSKSDAKSEGGRMEPSKTEPPKADAVSESPAGDAPVPAAAQPPRRSLAEAEQKVLAAPARATSPSASTPPAPAAEPVVSVPPTAPPATTPTSPEPAAPTPAAATSVAATPPAAQSEPPPAGFSVQLAAFSDDKGANALSNKLKKAGYPAYTEPLATSKGTLWRVRVGPYPSRDAAVSSRDKLKGEGYSGIVASTK